MKKLLEQVEKRIEELQKEREQALIALGEIAVRRIEVNAIRDMIKARMEEVPEFHDPPKVEPARFDGKSLGCTWRLSRNARGQICTQDCWRGEKCDNNRLKGCPKREGDSSKAERGPCKFRKNDRCNERRCSRIEPHVWASMRKCDDDEHDRCNVRDVDVLGAQNV
tara:strand:- start:309 stop:806 length:498 start_codon:yes stop_codon:yes gene_type:complete